MSASTDGQDAVALLKRVSDLEAEAARLRGDVAVLVQGARDSGHDFTDVLQAIICHAEFLMDDASDQAQTAEWSGKILASAAKGVKLARNLMITSPGSAAIGPEAAGMTPAQSPSQAAFAPGRILVVEDQETIREFIRTILVKAGHDVAVAGNGVEAVDAICSADFDLVLMDIHMPVMNGLDATRRIRELGEARGKVPIIGISGNVPLQHVRSILDSGMNDHIGKPFRKEALLEKVATWLKASEGSPRTAPSAQGKTGGTAFDEVSALMGRPWVELGLTRLGAQIDEAFGSDPNAARADGRLASQSHALVSLAALLGFSTLSQLCSVLEQACRSEGDIRQPYADARAAALQAGKEAKVLLAGG